MMKDTVEVEDSSEIEVEAISKSKSKSISKSKSGSGSGSGSGMGMGITTYIRDILRGGQKLRVGNVSKKRKYVGESKGLRNGRYQDKLFREVIEGKEELVPKRNKRHEVLGYVFLELRKQGIIITEVQVGVSKEIETGEGKKKIKIRTLLDGLGYRGKEVVVFELKTTLSTVREHEMRYKQVCKNVTVMKNGCDNTEYSGHCVQTGFGVMCIKERMKEEGYGGVGVVGVVCVGCVDGAKLYYVGSEYSSRRMYERVSVPYGIMREKRKKSSNNVRGENFVEWPTVYNNCPKIMGMIRERGYTGVGGKVGKLGVLEAVVGGKVTAYGIVGVISGLNESLSLSFGGKGTMKQKRKVVAESKKMWIKYKKKIVIQGMIMYKEKISTVVTYVQKK